MPGQEPLEVQEQNRQEGTAEEQRLKELERQEEDKKKHASQVHIGRDGTQPDQGKERPAGYQGPGMEVDKNIPRPEYTKE